MTSAAETFAAAARIPAHDDHDARTQRRMMAHMGTEALVYYCIDAAEHHRRREAGVGPIRSVDVLELLLGLPLGIEVPVAALSRREQAVLPHAPRGVVSVTGGEVVRHAVPPASVQLAVVAAKTWRQGLVLAGRYAPFCSPAVVLSTRPADLEDMRMQADFYGVGVGVVSAGRAEVLVEPAPFVRYRFTAAGWRFLEDVYRIGR